MKWMQWLLLFPGLTLLYALCLGMSGASLEVAFLLSAVLTAARLLGVDSWFVSRLIRLIFSEEFSPTIVGRLCTSGLIVAMLMPIRLPDDPRLGFVAQFGINYIFGAALMFVCFLVESRRAHNVQNRQVSD